LKQETSPLIEKLSNFVAQEEDINNQFWWWMSGEQISHFMLALAKYDQWKQNTNPDLTVTVTNDTTVLLDKTFDINSEDPVQKSIYFEDLKSSSYVNFTASGVGEASVIFGATFIPAEIPSDPIDRGIIVNRIIQLVDPQTNDPTGQPITEASIGSLVLTTIEVILRDYSDAINIIDAFPGALDPLDDSIYDINSQSNAPSYLWWFYYWGAFSQKEFRQDKVVFHGQNLYPGTYTVKYYSLVNTPGLFILPPTIAYDVFQPELMGSTSGGIFTTTGYQTSTIINLGTCLPWERTPLPSFDDETNTPQEIDAIDGESSSLIIGLAVGLSLFFATLLFIGAVIYIKFFHLPKTADDKVTSVPSL